MRYAKLTAEQVTDARQRYAAGETARTLAGHYGLSVNAIRMALSGRTWGHVPGAVAIDPNRDIRRKFDERSVRVIRQLYKDGRTLQSIAVHYGVSHVAIYNVVNGHYYRNIT